MRDTYQQEKVMWLGVITVTFIILLILKSMSLQSEVCLWTILGLIRTIFDATLFKVNANLKQVWQMTMPEELSRSIQRGLRTMISGIMLVQCFTVYVYLATYIVLLYPVFLEERPTLILPWLLLAAIRNFLCELTSLAVGLGTCVLLGPGRPPCIKFVVIKAVSIMPLFYMWMLLYSYYDFLKLSTLCKTFPVVLPPNEHDYGLELAVRRRRTKSLLGEDQLRTRIIANLYNDGKIDNTNRKSDYSSRIAHGTDPSTEDLIENANIFQPLSAISNRTISDTGCSEDWLTNEVVVPRVTDRILEQFGVMMLQISAYLSRENINSDTLNSQLLHTSSENEYSRNNIDTMLSSGTDPPSIVGCSESKTASYLRDYPQIFMKKPEILMHADLTMTLTSDHGMTLQKPENNGDGCNDNIPRDNGLRGQNDSAQKLDQEGTDQKNLQMISSEKFVTFDKIKHKTTLQDVTPNDGAIDVAAEMFEQGTSTRNENEPEIDSLESIIEHMKKRDNLKNSRYINK